VFAENVVDKLRGRVVPALDTSSVPDHEFWRDIDLETPLPRRGLFDSVLAHAALLGLLYAVSIWPNSLVHLTESRSFRTLSGYNLSEYLPELHGKPTRHRQTGKADPVQAMQEIRSLPNAPDNLRQTIVTPPNLKLKNDVALPNLVAYGPIPAAPALEAASQTVKLRLPAMLPEVMAPAVETGSLRSRSKVPSLMPWVVEPSPEIAQTNPRLALPSFQPNVVQPAPEVGSVSRGGSTSLARLLPSSGSDPVPPAPTVGGAHRASGQLLALSLHPSEVRAPVEVPEGNRRGAFAASPTGHANATGAPGAEASGTSGGGRERNQANAPAGIDVGPAPAPTAAMAGPNAPTPQAGATSPTSPTNLGAVNPDTRAKLLAAMRTPPDASISHPPAHETTRARSELENRIFAGRRSYTLSVNMPNLNTATGSWIIHFVERTPNLTSSPIAAPEVLRKSDPAYPGELIHDGVQGTVVLTAIIHADGSVSDIAVAKSLDPRLDKNAMQALARWLFRPALKNGQAIDLEAVITVPFRTKPTSF
jgi:TonB family protein